MTNQNWQSLGAGGLYGGNTAGGGGVPVARDGLDEKRMGLPRTPQAEYPDGYLGTIRSRRDDRLLDSLKSRVGQKQYQRGVHKGERIEQSSYMWPPDLSPQRGLANNAIGMRTAPVMAMAPAPNLVNDGKAQMKSDAPAAMNERKVALLGNLRPTWR